MQDSYNLPGVAGLFWTHADEERAHAKVGLGESEVVGSVKTSRQGFKFGWACPDSDPNFKRKKTDPEPDLTFEKIGSGSDKNI